MKIAVLGGGLSGLSAAFHLSRRFPRSQITLLEKQSRLGGWVHSERINLDFNNNKDHNVLLEYGPRTLRPNAKAVLELVHLLNLKDKLVITPKSAPAARNRFIYVPPAYREEHGLSGLIKLPTSVLGFLKSPLRGIMLPAISREPFKRRSISGSEDVSLHDLLARRFSPDFARVLGSALVHGIYAADSRKVSAEAAFTSLFELEKEGGGSISRGMLVRAWKAFIETQKALRDSPPHEDFELGDVARFLEHENTSVFSFQDGLQALPAALENYLRKQPNVRLMTDVGVSSISASNSTEQFTLKTNSETVEATHLASALPAPVLHSILSDNIPIKESPLLHDSRAYFSTVTVINLVFPQPPPNAPPLHPPGFGFLVPRPPEELSSTSTSSTTSGNPLGILGVVFDSSSLGAQDQPKNQICKMTVMLGGPYARQPGFTVPSIPEVLQFVSTALGRELSDPIHVESRTHADCIPHPRVGHGALLRALMSAGQEGDWTAKRLAVIGPGITGVSVGDCVNAGRDVGKQWE